MERCNSKIPTCCPTRGCKHLNPKVLRNMQNHGYDPGNLITVEQIMEIFGIWESKMEELCAGGAPRYRNDNDQILVQPHEFLDWYQQLLY